MRRGAGTRAPLLLVATAGIVVALLLPPARVPGDPRRGRRQSARRARRGRDLATRLEHSHPGRRRRHGDDRRRRPARLARHTNRSSCATGLGHGRRASARDPELRGGVLPARLLRLSRLLADALAVDRLPEVKGYWGSLAALTLATYPYVFLLTRSSLQSLDPSLEEAARGLGVSGRRTLLRVTAPAIRSAVGLGALLVALYTLSDFGVVSLMDYDTLTRAIYVQYKSLFDRAPAATLALLLVALTALALVVEYRTRRRGRLYRAGPGTQRQPPIVRLGRWRGCGAGLLQPRRRALPRPARGRARVLARPRNRKRTRARHPVERGRQLAHGFRACRCRGRRRGDSRRHPGASLPVAVVAHARAALVRRQCAPGDSS